MRLRRRLVGPLAIVIFSLGLLLGTALFGGLVWADFESILLDPVWRRPTPLRSLRCPVMITTSETGVASAVVSNPLDRPTERYLRVFMSSGSMLLTREFTEVVPLDPGETRRVTWTVTADDAAYGRLIMINAVLRRRYPLPGRQSSCGIIVLDVPYLTGHQVFGLSLAASLLAMGAGYWLWIKATPPPGRRERQAGRAMIGLTGGVVAGIALGLLGWWLPGLILFVVVLVGVGVIIGYFLNTD